MIAQPVLIESELLLPPVYNPRVELPEKLLHVSCDLRHKLCMNTYFLKCSHKKLKSAMGGDQEYRCHQWRHPFTLQAICYYDNFS